MNKKILTSSALAALSLCTLGHSAIYSSNFNSPGYSVGDLDGQNGWVTSDTGTDVAYVEDQSLTGWPGSYGQVASIGYVDTLSTSQPYTYHNVNTPFIQDYLTTFSVEMVIRDSSNTAPDRDGFGFRLENSSGDNLFSLEFDPISQSGAPSGSTRFDTVSWSSGATTGSTPYLLQEDSRWKFDIVFYGSGVNDIGFMATLTGVGSVNFSGVLPGVASESITRMGAFWDAGGSSGDNYMQFDNISLVPEPSSALLIALGAAVTLRRKRD